MEIPTFKFAIREGLDNHCCDGQDKAWKAEDFLPTKSDPEATGYDVRCAEMCYIYSYEYVKIPLGFRAFCPPGWWFELRPRSSSHAKKHLHSLYGVIDETYENELIFSCQFIPESGEMAPLVIELGERIGQIIPVRRQEMNVEIVSNKDFDALCQQRNAQRKGGLGSTGDK